MAQINLILRSRIRLLKLASRHGEVPTEILLLVLNSRVAVPEKSKIVPIPARIGPKILANFWLKLVGESLLRSCPKIFLRVSYRRQAIM